jgi:tetratricopeptide (TPR) repeat protein
MTGPFGDLTALVQHLDRRLDSQPAYADLRNQRGVARVLTGDVGGARDDFEAALKSNPDYGVARFNLAWLHIEHGDRAAGGLATAVARQLPEAWRAHLAQLEAVRHGGVDAVLSNLVVPSDSSPWFDLQRLWLLVRAGRHADAEAQAQRIAARDADLPSLLHVAGILQRNRADARALAVWADAYRGNPHVASLCHAAADCAAAAGRLEDSRRHLAWGAALSLDLGAYWIAIGTQHDSRGEERAALVAMRRAVQVDPDRIAARVAFGFLLAARSQAEEAIAELEAAVRLAPNYADVRYQLGLLYAEVQRSDAAEAHLRAALAVHPGYVLAKLALGCLLEARGRDAEALQLLQQVRQSGLRSSDLEQRLAVVHERLGHPIQARRARARARAASRG